MAPADATGSLQRVGVAALLVLAAVLPYVGALHYPFIFDDDHAIVENERIRTLWPISEPLTVDPETSLASRPIAQLSLAINYAISGLSPWSYRLGNLALHAACALLIWRLLERVLRSGREAGRDPRTAGFVAAAVALLWAVHPLNTEAVVYITQRTELLVSVFLLGTIAASVRGFDASAAGSAGRARAWWLAAAVSCWLGMASKEVMAAAPLLVLLIDRGVVSGTFAAALRRHWPLYAALAASWGLLAAVIVLSPRRQSAGFDLGVSPLESLYTQADVILLYLRLAFWPHPLSIVYHVEIARSIGASMPGGLVIAVLVAATAIALWRNHPAGLAGAWFFLILAPSSSIVPILNEVAAERRMYLPLVAVIALTLVVVVRLGRAARWRLPRWIAGLPVAVAAVTLMMVSLARLQAYRTVSGIWEDALRAQPRSYLAHAGYGNALIELGEVDRGFEHRLIAVRLNPFLPERTLEVTSMLLERGRYEEALHWLTHLVEHAKPNAIVLVNRGTAFAVLGREAEAEADLREAIRLDPGLAEPWLNLGVMRAKAGRLKEARELVAEALKRAPESAQARGTLEMIERELRQRNAPRSAP